LTILRASLLLRSKRVMWLEKGCLIRKLQRHICVNQKIIIQYAKKASKLHEKNFLSKKELGIEIKSDERSKFHLIQGNYPFRLSFGSIDIVAAPKDSPPFSIDAVAVEEDTFLVLSADPKVRDPHMDLVRIMTNVIKTRPEKPGTVLVRGKHPLLLLAIVHDFNQKPSCKEKWIVSALNEIFRLTKIRDLTSIALPLLGTLHGSMKKQRFIVLLSHSLKKFSTRHLKRIWLIVPPGTSSKIFQKFQFTSNR
jgi:hypothetical protein